MANPASAADNSLWNSDDSDEFDDHVDIVVGNDDFDENIGSENSSDESLPDTEAVLVKTPDIILERHTGSVFCARVHNEKIVTGGEDDIAVIWNANSGSIIDEISFTDSVVAVDISYDGAFVCMGDMNGVLQVRDLVKNEIVFATDIGCDINWLKWHPIKNVIFIGTSEGEVYMYHIPGGECKVLPGHAVSAECGIVNGNCAIIGYSDGVVCIFDICQTKVLHSVCVSQQVVCLDVLEERNLIAVGDSSGGVTVIARNRGQVIARFDTVKPTGSEPDVEENTLVSVESVVFLQPLLPDNTPMVAAGNLGGHFCLWDVSREVLRYVVKLNQGITKLLRQSHFVYVACLKGKIYKLDGRSGEIVGKFRRHSRDVLDIYLSPDGCKLLSTSDDKLVCVFSLEH